MNFRKMIDEIIFNDHLHRQKSLLPPDHPNTGNINVINLWNNFHYINDMYEYQLKEEKNE